MAPSKYRRKPVSNARDNTPFPPINNIPSPFNAFPIPKVQDKPIGYEKPSIVKPTNLFTSSFPTPTSPKKQQALVNPFISRIPILSSPKHQQNQQQLEQQKEQHQQHEQTKEQQQEQIPYQSFDIAESNPFLNDESNDTSLTATTTTSTSRLTSLFLKVAQEEHSTTSLSLPEPVYYMDIDDEDFNPVSSVNQTNNFPFTQTCEEETPIDDPMELDSLEFTMEVLLLNQSLHSIEQPQQQEQLIEQLIEQPQQQEQLLEQLIEQPQQQQEPIEHLIEQPQQQQEPIEHLIEQPQRQQQPIEQLIEQPIQQQQQQQEQSLSNTSTSLSVAGPTDEKVQLMKKQLKGELFSELTLAVPEDDFVEEVVDNLGFSIREDKEDVAGQEDNKEDVAKEADVARQEDKEDIVEEEDKEDIAEEEDNEDVVMEEDNKENVASEEDNKENVASEEDIVAREAEVDFKSLEPRRKRKPIELDDVLDFEQDSRPIKKQKLVHQEEEEAPLVGAKIANLKENLGKSEEEARKSFKEDVDGKKFNNENMGNGEEDKMEKERCVLWEIGNRPNKSTGIKKIKCTRKRKVEQDIFILSKDRSSSKLAFNDCLDASIRQFKKLRI